MASEQTVRFSFLATVTGFIVDSATIMSWLLNLITAVALASRGGPTQVFGTFRLGTWYQLVLLIAAGFAYIHFLRRYWRKETYKILDDPVSDIFRNFLWGDLPSLKRPILLIPIFLFYFAWGAVAFFAINSQYSESIVSGYTILMLMFLSLAVAFYKSDFDVQDDPVQTTFQKWNRDRDLQNMWIERINKRIEEKGSANTFDFHGTVGLDATQYDQWLEIDWALQTYFYYFENDGAKMTGVYDIIIDDYPNDYALACRTVSY